MARRGWQLGAAVVGVSVALAGGGDRAASPDLVIAVPGTPLSLVTLDADGDARPDLAVALDGDPARVTLLAAARDGAAASAVALPDLDGAHGPLRALLAGDLDRDGRTDLVGIGATPTLWRGRGDGAFLPEPLPDEADGERAVAADLDADGAPELVVARRTGVVVLRNDGRGVFAPAAEVASPDLELVREVVVADADGDGTRDVLVLCGPAGRAWSFRGTGGGAVSEPAPLAVPDGCFALQPTADGAGLVAFGRHVARTFAAGTPSDTALDGGDIAAALGAGDVDGDGVGDLLALADGGGVVAFVARGGSFARVHAFGERSLDAPFAPTAGRAGVADFDGDGRADLAVGVLRPRSGVAVLPGVAPASPAPPLLLARGVLTDRGRARGDRLVLEGELPPATLAANATLEVSVSAGGASIEASLERVRGSTYRTSPHAAIRARAVVDPERGRFELVADAFDFAAEPSNPVVVRLGTAAAVRTHTATWTASRPGELRFGDERDGATPRDPGARGARKQPGGAAASAFELTTTTIDGRAVALLREPATGRTWRLDDATGQWVETSADGTERRAARDAQAPAAETARPLPCYNVIPKHSGLFLAIREARLDEGADAIQWTPTGCDAQRFEVVPAGAGRVRLRVVRSGKWLTVAGNATHDGARIVQTGDASAPATLWQLVPEGDDWFRIRSVHSGQSMAVAARETGRGSLVIQWPGYPDDEQLFRFVPSERKAPTPVDPRPREDSTSAAPERPAAERVTLTFDGVIDGSDRVVITATEARWENVYWGTYDVEVTLNGVKWRPARQRVLPNSGATRFLPPGVDLAKAQIVSRAGRDHAAIETAPGRLTLRFVDSPNGVDRYGLVVAFE